MKELSLRIRGAKEVQKILKRKPGAKVDISEDEDEDGFDEETDAMTADDIADENLDDVLSVTSVDSEFSTVTTPGVLQAGRSDAMVEDSEDEIEILKM
jgi:hypothetical protein